MKRQVTTTTVNPDSVHGRRTVEMLLAIGAFLALHLMLISALPFRAAYYAVLPIGAAVAFLGVWFYDKKYAILYVIAGLVVLTGACMGAFSLMQNGALAFANGAVARMNETRHAGYESYLVNASFGADFLFAAILSAWVALVGVVAVKVRYVFVGLSVVLLVTLLCIGLYPNYFAVAGWALVLVCLLSWHSGFHVKALLSYLACAAVLSLALLPCYFFGGSQSITRFSKATSASFDNALYGTSMPNGRLADSYGMKSSDEVRLELTLSRLTPSLYLRGFVGSEFDGAAWSPTDKNAYVENGYQGLMDYLAQGRLPTLQYAQYSHLNSANNHYTVTVKNVSADRRYVYTPYTLSEYSVGSAYYDLGIRSGALAPKSYSYTVFASDVSSERLSQAGWIMQDADRSAEMEKYATLEGQYRAFVYDTYLSLDETTLATVKSALGGFETDSINTATQFIRAYFLDAYHYQEECDRVGSDFIGEFFGGEIGNGNAAYFATAATCMFRAMGFAARYVEGYTVNADASSAETATLSVQVTGQNTHAWTEVYFDGVGFLPIEVTPTFFSEQPPEVTIDPNDPDISGSGSTENEPGNPSLPDDEQQAPDVPYEPPVDEPEPPATKTSKLFVALKVLVPVTSVAAVLLLIALTAVLRRRTVRVRRLKALEAGGAEFGRAAYKMLKEDCKRFGGFDGERLKQLGVSERGTKRFIRIAEQCVYGGYEPGDTERKFVLWYIQTVQAALLKDCGFFRSLYYKYVVCIVI